MSEDNRVVIVNQTPVSGSTDAASVVAALMASPAMLAQLAQALRPELYPATQPATPGHWRNNGVLTFWDGTNNHAIDFNEGAQTSVFGTPIGDV